MKRKITLAALLGAVAFSGCTVGQDSASLRKQQAASGGVGKIIEPIGATNLTSEGGQFSIYFPAKPTQKRTVLTSGGKREEFHFLSRSGVATYQVLVTTIPPEDLTPAAEGLEQLRRSFEKTKPGSKLEKSQKITLNGVHGYEIRRSERNGNARTLLRVYDAPKIMYLIIVTTRSKKYFSPSEFQVQTKQVEKVMSSFRILAS